MLILAFDGVVRIPAQITSHRGYVRQCRARRTRVADCVAANGELHATRNKGLPAERMIAMSVVIDLQDASSCRMSFRMLDSCGNAVPDMPSHFESSVVTRSRFEEELLVSRPDLVDA